MGTEPLERKLAAILYADVAGYSRLTGEDEDGTHRTLSEYLDLISRTVEEFRGRVMHYAGDAVLAKFDAVVDAVSAAVAIQHELQGRNQDLSDPRKVQFRIGVNIGDVIEDRGDIYGDGVNVAARLESLAEPGGICISESVRTAIGKKLPLDYESLGKQRVKNIEEPVHAYHARLKPGAVPFKPARPTGAEHEPPMEQEIRFCTASDGVRIAYATVGEGPPLVKAANWLNHLEYDWHSPVWRHVPRELAKDHLLVRYDERGNGLSDWNVDDISFEAFVRDLETVVDVVGLERFALLGVSQGCPVSVAYAVRHPERVTHLILYGGYVKGVLKRGSQELIDNHQALQTLIVQGWGQENPAYRQVFTSRFIPGATLEQMQWFNDLERMTTSPENAVRLRQVFHEIDVSALVSQVAVPTLVLHVRGDATAATFEQGRQLAMSIPGARFVPLEGQNHLILEDELAWPRFLAEVRGFLTAK
jgi:class 3 adenylate cyclase/pimeloyl-ACP methyl ester carboxylesterase